MFYLWRRLINRHRLARYALAPAYVAACALLVAAARRRVSRLWLAGFAVCLVAQLLPAWLLELRWVRRSSGYAGSAGRSSVLGAACWSRES